jgi:hypothetical protein
LRRLSRCRKRRAIWRKANADCASWSDWPSIAGTAKSQASPIRKATVANCPWRRRSKTGGTRQQRVLSQRYRSNRPRIPRRSLSLRPAREGSRRFAAGGCGFCACLGSGKHPADARRSPRRFCGSLTLPRPRRGASCHTRLGGSLTFPRTPRRPVRLNTVFLAACSTQTTPGSSARSRR